MTHFESVIIGAVQGLAEFLPVSSSGHLVLGRHFLKLSEEPVLLVVALHLATLLVVFIVFRKRLLSVLFPLNKAYLAAIVTASIPTAILGLGVKTMGGLFFETPLLTSCILIVNGLMLLAVYYFSRSSSSELRDVPNLKQAFLIGIAQGFAVLPGISRSGATIGSGRLLGLSPSGAAEFSFLAAVPAILGATLLEAKDMSIKIENLSAFLAACLIAFVLGWIAAIVLLKVVRSGKWLGWAVYCIAAGSLSLVFILSES